MTKATDHLLVWSLGPGADFKESPRCSVSSRNNFAGPACRLDA